MVSHEGILGCISPWHCRAHLYLDMSQTHWSSSYKCIMQLGNILCNEKFIHSQIYSKANKLFCKCCVMMDLKGIIHPKVEIQSLSTHLHAGEKTSEVSLSKQT